MPKRVLSGAGIVPGALPFSPVVEANGLVFLAGQVGDVPGTPGPCWTMSGDSCTPPA
jgi:enamine deaminase RidA (YjgF/YER057c/UK114 family)